MRAAVGITGALVFALACGSERDDAPARARWSVVGEHLPAALLSVWAGAGEVYAVGADDGEGPLVLRLAGERWQRLETGERGNLWWVTDGPGGTLWMVGEHGLVLRHDRKDESFTRVDTPTDLTLFGIDFAGPAEAIAVGGTAGDPTRADTGGIVLRLQGDAFVADDRVEPSWLDQRTVFKVWAPEPGVAWLVGERGLVLRLRDGGFERFDAHTSERLLTVHGAEPDAPLIVGGLNNAALLEIDGDDVHDRSLELDEGFAPALNGVSSPTAELALIVGNRGFIAERERGGELTWLSDAPTQKHLHAAAVGPDGQGWAVGGNLLSAALDDGVLLHRGSAAVPSIEEP